MVQEAQEGEGGLPSAGHRVHIYIHKYLGGFKGSLGYRDPISNKNTSKIPTGGWAPVNLAEIHAILLTQQV